MLVFEYYRKGKAYWDKHDDILQYRPQYRFVMIYKYLLIAIKQNEIESVFILMRTPSKYRQHQYKRTPDKENDSGNHLHFIKPTLFIQPDG